jgi:hypothetical protein
MPEILEESWNFSLCPQAEERACVVYEYLLEIEPLRREFQKWKRTNSNRVAFSFFQKGDAVETPQRYRASLNAVFIESLCKSAPGKLQRLPIEILSLLAYFSAYFPEKHWLQIPSDFRTRQLKSWRPKIGVFDVTGCKGNTSDFIKGCLNRPLIATTDKPGAHISAGLGDIALEIIKGFPPVREHTLLIDWTVSLTTIREQLLAWVDAQPKDHYIGAIKFPETKTREQARTEEQHLKNLAGLRLMRALGNKWQLCAEHSKHSWHHTQVGKSKRKKSGQRETRPREIFSRADRWSTAARIAEQEIRRWADLAER